MHFTQVTQPEIIASIVKSGTGCITITYESGKEWTVTSIIWSAIKNRDDASIPTGGYINFFQTGAVSGTGIAGVAVDTNNPLTFDSVVYTEIDTLIAHLLTVLI
jgi:hypothetical protein